ncbi:uncharacterized protein LOC106089091 [Stomoxys calcitrans]|uniref:Salivary secreted peptide n=1 Tax=Stomoxys calcitrans TaxID=35570 RepID=A0A1I8NRV8_STOCA|nr:uncharacterized protein LOC106089091 [Stomoxys calcitrans]
MSPHKYSQLIVASVLALIVGVLAHDVHWGDIGPGNKVVAFERVTRKPNPLKLQFSILTNVKYPPKGHTSIYNLTGIRLVDNGLPNNYGYAVLKSGGPGYPYSTIEIKSQRNKPINMSISYYASALKNRRY